MTKEQFFQTGCPSPECEGLSMVENDGRVVACTTTNYQGFISMMRPGAFVSRFSGIDKRRPGCYALSVKGRIPDFILNEANDEDISLGKSTSQPKSARIPDDTQSEAASSSSGDEDDMPLAKRARLETVEADAPGEEGVVDAVGGSASERRTSAEESAVQSDRTGISKASSSTMILEPEGDAEFNRAWAEPSSESLDPNSEPLGPNTDPT
eukprot:CAMPEP_0170606348 /NCGR_PEP_ID=MMETSP0224-20130122/20466_1 /TAXON_ID=285029 /ORGANISM="Togula jolla, Strain CCCM 725" /LENGTH=209 /DNA_ID=CAMNT_0010931427 /DNA_START=157 /DNA_END=783 /DNA_ORIENTATION=-